MSRDDVTALVARVIGTLKRARLATGREDDTQLDIARALAAAGIDFQREHRLSPADRLDFWLDGLVIEVKLRGNSKAAIYRQLERYARHPDVRAILLITGTATGLPPEIEGKPAYYLSVGASWL